MAIIKYDIKKGRAFDINANPVVIVNGSEIDDFDFEEEPATPGKVIEIDLNLIITPEDAQKVIKCNYKDWTVVFFISEDGNIIQNAGYGINEDNWIELE